LNCQTADIEEAIKAATEALASVHGDIASEQMYLLTLAGCLASRFLATNDLHDLDKSIAISRKTIALMPATNPQRLKSIYNLGSRIYDRHVASTDLEERRQYLQEAVDAAKEVVDGTAENSVDMPRYIRQLGLRQVMLDMFTMTEYTSVPSTEKMVAASFKDAAAVFERAFSKMYDTPLGRIENGDSAGYFYMSCGEWAKASEISSEAIKMFRLICPESLRENDRQRRMRGLSGNSARACASFIALGKLEKGIEVLIAGRGILPNITMRYQDELPSLKTEEPELHPDYTALRHALAQPLPNSILHSEDVVAQRNQQLVRLRAMEGQIRSIPGFESFNQNLSAAEIRRLASEGPLVAFCTVDQRCDALIVTTDKVELISLPKLKSADIRERIPLMTGPKRLSKYPPSRRSVANKKLRNLLAWLWDSAVQPALKHLDLLSQDQVKTPPRLWWITSGPLGLMPLQCCWSRLDQTI
jgi:hypothetical protein